MNHYLAIVIGPVYKTIKQARSTREIWAASYLFSILMREILSAAEEAKIGTLLSPPILHRDDHRFGAGLYPDKAFWKLDGPNAHEQLHQIKKNALTKLQNEVGLDPDIIEKHFRLYAIKMEILPDSKDKILKELNKLLDNLELQEKITEIEPKLLWKNILGCIQQLYNDGHTNQPSEGSVFVEYVCGGKSLKRLSCIMEIATHDLAHKTPANGLTYKTIVTDPISMEVCEMIQQSKDKDWKKYNEGEEAKQDEVLTEIKKQFRNDFRFRHKYIAFVLADGDNMGACISAIGNDEQKIENFSKELSKFASEAAELIYKYGGLPIYAGGDDLLFAIPLANTKPETLETNGRNIFELLSKIDKKFPADELEALAGGIVSPSMSYGISVSYYKYPMDEALDVAESCLHLAKNIPKKNAVAFSVRKHSGQTYTGCLPKKERESFEHFFQMMEEYGDSKFDAFLSSLSYKLAELQPLAVDALLHKSLPWFFKNHLNEKDHGDKFNDYLRDARILMETLFLEYKSVFKDREDNMADFKKAFAAGGFSHEEVQYYFESQALAKPGLAAAIFVVRQVYGCLRFIQFLNQKENVPANIGADVTV